MVPGLPLLLLSVFQSSIIFVILLLLILFKCINLLKIIMITELKIAPLFSWQTATVLVLETIQCGVLLPS